MILNIWNHQLFKSPMNAWSEWREVQEEEEEEEEEEGCSLHYENKSLECESGGEQIANPLFSHRPIMIRWCSVGEGLKEK